MENNFDTIVAIITPLATSAVCVIRISGSNAINIAQSIFDKKIKPKMINYGHIIDKSGIIDEVILLPFLAPHSYTGEDVVEIQTHGSIPIINNVLELLLSKGARLAQKGEFTKRAFLNQRIDLSQAESVMDIISSSNIKSARNSLSNLDGFFSKKINKLKNNLELIYSKIIASIDFPEDVAQVEQKEVVSICNDNITDINSILEVAKCHDFIKDGFKASLIGKPNVGKSSLFNALLNYERAIVTDIAGTTRDTISEVININGYILNIVDTAGIRKEGDIGTVEKIGIDNSIKAINDSQIVIFLFENNIDEIDKNLINLAKNKKIIYVKTKCDKITDETIDNDNIIQTSSKENKGISTLKQALAKTISELIPQDIDYTVNKRHQVCLIKCKESLKEVLNTASEFNDSDESLELFSQDLKQAILSLGEITGEVLTDNILDKIFDQFCIGK